MSRLALILIVMAATLLMAPASPQGKVNPPRNEKIEESIRKVKELKKERIEVLKSLVEGSVKLYQNARVEIDEPLEARVLLFKAELEAAEKQSDRITIYKNHIEDLKNYLQVAVTKKASGRGTELAVLKVKAKILEVEIHLEQAKIKEAKESK